MEQTITKTGRSGPRGKVLEFRDNLIPANSNNYANVHGRGGNDVLESTGEVLPKALNSTIQVLLADKEQHIECIAGLSPEIIRLLYEISLQRMTEGSFLLSKLSLDKLHLCYDSLKEAATGKSSNDQVPVSKIIDSGKILKSTIEDIENSKGSFKYDQVRVHKHKLGVEGICPIQSISIIRNESINGIIQQLPWKFSLMCGKAKPSENGLGYVKESLTDVKKAEIKLSDIEMYQLMAENVAFLNMFEQAMCAPVVKDGVTNVKAELIKQRSQKQ